MIVALGVVLSPILRVPGMAPMQHFINVIAGVLFGPFGALLCALLIGILRMATLGINILAISGAIFGAFFSGLLFDLTKRNFLGSVVGELIGTGLIGAMISFPLMRILYNNDAVALLTYIPGFSLASLVGSTLAFIFLKFFSRTNVYKDWMNNER